MIPANEKLFDQLMSARVNKQLPPVEQWHPQKQVFIDIRIAADGSWFHEGDQIKRPAMVRLFAGILRKDSLGFALVTPVERLAIEVEDAPFIAVDFEVKRSSDNKTDLLFTTNVEDYVLAGPDHALTWKALL